MSFSRFSFLKNFFFFIFITAVIILFNLFQENIASLINFEKAEKRYYLNLQNEMIRQIENNFVEKNIDVESLLIGSLKGLFESLDDPYSQFLDKNTFKKSIEGIKESFGGIGIYIHYDEEKKWIQIREVMRNSPAEKAGLQKNDFIVKVNGNEVKKMTFEDAVLQVKGPVDSYVELLISRKGEKAFSKKIQRKIMNTPNLEYDLIKKNKLNIGYIKFHLFGQKTFNKFKKAIKELEKKDFRYLIIDLRNNTGGLMNTAVNIADLFLKKGKIVYTMSRENKIINDYQASSKILVKENIPVFILGNGLSASAAEIFIAALKENNRASFWGQKTFGKASVQIFHPIKDIHGKVSMGFRLTSQYYYTPLGKLIHKKGIIPNRIIKKPEIKNLCDLEKLVKASYAKDFLSKNPLYTQKDLSRWQIFLKEKKQIDLPIDYLILNLENEKQKTMPIKDIPIYNLYSDFELKELVNFIGENFKNKS